MQTEHIFENGICVRIYSFIATGDNNRFFANSIDPDETAQWAVSSGYTLFDIQSFNFTYKRLS